MCSLSRSARRNGAGSTYCGGRSSLGFRPPCRQSWSARRTPHFCSKASWAPWSSSAESSHRRYPQGQREAWWFLPWPSPLFSSLPCCLPILSLLPSGAVAPRWPPTSQQLCLFPPPTLLHHHRSDPHNLTLLNPGGQMVRWRTQLTPSRTACPLGRE